MKQSILQFICLTFCISIYAQIAHLPEGDTNLANNDSLTVNNSAPKTPAPYFSISFLLKSLPSDSVGINRSKLFFHPVYRHNSKNSFSRKQNWQAITRLVGYTVLSSIGANNNFIYTLP